MSAEWHLARVEAMRMVRNPVLVLPFGASLLWARQIDPAASDDMNVYFLLVGFALVLPAFVMMAITVLAVLRSRSSGTEPLLETLPVGRDRRTVGHGLATLGCGALAVLTVVALIVYLRPGSPLGVTEDTIPNLVDIPRPNLAQLLQGPVAVVVYCTFGIALVRWLPSWLVIVALVIPTAMQFLIFGIWSGSHTTAANWLTPVSTGMVTDDWVGCGEGDPRCDLPVSGFDRVTPWWHLAYMVSLAAALIAVAVLRDRRDRRAWWLAAGACGTVVVLAAVQWVVYERYVPGV